MYILVFSSIVHPYFGLSFLLSFLPRTSRGKIFCQRRPRGG